MAVRREYGQRFFLSDENSLWNLLKLSSESSNRTIITAFLQFLNGLDQIQKEQLAYRGVAVIKESNINDSLDGHSLHNDKSPVINTTDKVQGQKIYRGQVVGNTKEETSFIPQAPKPKPAPKPPAKRIYRGRVIEE